MTDVNYFDGQNATAGNGNASGGSWLVLLAGLGAVALGAYALLRGGKTSSSDDTGGGFFESLGGGSEETGGTTSTVPDVPTLPTQPGTSGSGNTDISTGDGSAIAAFAESYGANPASVANVFKLSNYGDEETNNILGAKYQTYLNTEKTLVTDASGNLVSLGSDLDPVLGLGKTIIFHQEKGEGLAGTPDSNALAASGLLAGAIAGVSQGQASIAAATSLAKWFDSPNIKDSSKANQVAAMGLAWSPQTGLTSRQSAIAAQQQAQVAAATQTNANIAAKQTAEKEAARQAALAAEAARQAEANRQSAIAAQQWAQTAKSSGSSGGFSTADRVASGGSSSSHGFFTGYTSKGSGGSSGGSSGGATSTAAGGKTTSGSSSSGSSSGSSSSKSSGGSYSVSTSSGTSSFTGSGGRFHH